jgi:hypothetical protein
MIRLMLVRGGIRSKNAHRVLLQRFRAHCGVDLDALVEGLEDEDETPEAVAA